MVLLEGQIEIFEEKRGNLLLLHFKGKLDAMSSPSVERKCFEYINNGAYQLVFDFGGVDFVSSAGMRMLLSITKRLKGLAGKVVLCSLTPGVMDVLVMSGFDHVLEIAKNVDEAVMRFGHKTPENQGIE
jgi:anti-sigma B factor antagonist/stage II sporulation protein AA (anti-sigma F factor antagonist)